MKCQYCKIEFIQNRKDQRFCSKKCRINQWNKLNKEHATKIKNKYYKIHKKEILTHNKKYRLKNINHVRKINLIWQKNNKEKHNKSTYKWFLKNRKIHLKNCKKYRDSHKKEIAQKIIEKYRNDENFRLIQNIRHRIRQAIKNNSKTAPSLELLGCTASECWNYLEDQFLSGMTRKNYGNGYNKWVIDHKKPINLFDLSNPEEQRKCFHYTNLQPMWWIDNLKKGSKF